MATSGKYPFPLLLPIGGVLNQSKTPLRLIIRPPSIYQGTIWHIKSWQYVPYVASTLKPKTRI